MTDHYWDSAVPGASEWYAPQNFDHIAKIRPLPQGDGIDFLFGCETDMDKHTTLGIPSERYGDFDFIIVPTTHLHMNTFTIEEKDFLDNETRVPLWVSRLGALLSKDLPFHKVGVAHLVCVLTSRTREENIANIARIPTSEMERLFSRAASLGVGIELNQSDMSFSDTEADIILRPFRIAKSCGCKFYLGSDAHHPQKFETTRAVFERTVTLLDLTENDKFHIGE